LAIVIQKKDSDPGAKLEPDAGEHGHILRRFGKKVKSGEVTFFISQLALMLEIGTSLTDALRAAADQTKNPAFEAVIRSMQLDLEEGRQLSDAMSRHPKIFRSVFVSMVKAGETGGYLKKILERTVEMQEKRQALITQVQSTLTYPAVLCVLSTVVIIFVLAGILPKFTVLFEGKESVLPFSTRFLMAMSASIKQYWWVYLVSIAGLIVALKFFKDSELGQALIDRFFVSAPLLSRISNKIYTAQLLRTLGNLMESQVPLIEALKVTRDTFSNRHFRLFIADITSHVKQGGRFAQKFADYPYVMESVKQMVATGEEVGSLPNVMLRLAVFYDNEIEQELKKISSMIEPVALIVMGVVVGLIVSSVILPIFKLSHTIH
jgi:type II secretory pathway component PulF